MLTVDALKELGADTAGGIARCAGDEGFYLKIVTMALADPGFDQLREAIEAGDLDTAFERAHALKGVTGNVGLTSLYDPIVEVTEDLRARKQVDYSAPLDSILGELAKLRALL